ncbi:MAG TPA: hypothetical protein VLZ31_02320, partial [Microbacteriaceae bacterium]|nr:hypothetical protein [Microbacteriaceae bacterium]
AQTQALTRRYARRQVSWFKRYPEIEWLEGLSERSVDVFSNIKCTRVLASGQYFCLYVDADDSKPLTAQAAKQICGSHEDIPFHGVIRAVPTERMGVEGEANLAEEPTAKWFLEQRDFAGRQISLSGNGLRAFVRFLLDTELHTMSDRRETLPVATSAGVRDTLVGVVGVSVDLGRWRLRQSTDKSLLIELGRLHAVSFFDEQYDDQNVSVEQLVGDQTVFVDRSTISVVDAVGHVSAKFFVVDLDGVQREVPSSGTGAVAAALFARHFGVETMVPNHWRVETAGGSLGVRMFATEDGEHVSINGPAEVIV